ncbi:hypothetical protein E3N88_16551 [Mikania micrantha]|uniref:Leucine-rich repeat-containing N-terminal plant-type domain-containing protein n=1 Tax=Mikania micrantha TaxID=192012 RepID=A0A5N6P0E4_9ASTR|nr:hypothetical protein E3N88_16551 [Mikania micrantha]
MRNNICHKHFVTPIPLFISLFLLATSFETREIGYYNYKCINKERDALLDFKSYIHQDPYGFFSTWTVEDEEASTGDCCEWFGVTCNTQTGHVTSLSLTEGNIEGKINVLGNLTGLQALSLSYIGNCKNENQDWLSRLSQLNHLRMDGISLAKENNWVNTILRLQKLSYLSLCECDLSRVMHPYSYSSINSSSSPSSIVSLYLTKNNLNSSMYQWLSPFASNRLVNLDLSHNKFNGIPKYLGNLCSLIYANFDNNSLSTRFPDFMNNLSGCTLITLEVLILSNNQLIGSLSDDIEKFSSLQILVLSNNQLNETISEKLWHLPKLQRLDVSSNSLNGVLSEYIGKTKILSINLSNNSLEGVPSEAHMSNLSDVEELDLSSCKLGPRFPKWIHALKNLTRISISNNRVSDTIPPEFWNMWPSRLTYMDLSFNSFYGPIPNVTSTLQHLNLSRNKFYGGISFLCQIVDGSLSFLDLSHNSFTGEIPDCLWHFKELVVLSLGHNNLSGRLPTSIQYLINLEVMHLYNNNLNGELPLSLKNCTMLTYLDLGNNKFSGYIPAWIGEKLSWLYALSLTSNNFYGTIPLQLCQLVQLQILDLYIGNARLCGLPLHKYCPGDKVPEITPFVDNSESGSGSEVAVELDTWFYIGGASGFATRFWIACGALLVNRLGRKTFFRSLDSLKDWFYVKMMVFIAKWRRAGHT